MLVDASGNAFASVEERCFRDLVALIQFTGRELVRMGIDPMGVLMQEPERGFCYPIYDNGRYLIGLLPVEGAP